jgi:hypothetical protein
MIITSVSSDLDKYYNLDKLVITKNILDPVTQKFTVEYVQYYFYNKLSELEPTKTVGLHLDRYA